MDSMNLKDFRPDNPEFDGEEDTLENNDSEIPSSIYHEEINTLKIDKLSNRVTIISIIIPCLIGAILIFAYLDIKERVVDVDLTKQNQVERISQQLEEKLNALDLKIAKNKYDLDTQLPELNSKSISLEGQIAKIASSKADSKTIKGEFAKLEKRIANNANQDKITLQSIERINKQTLASIKESQSQFDKTALKIKEETTLFKEEFDARLLELSDYEQQIGELRKDFSILDKKYKRLEQESLSQSALDEKTTLLEADFNAQLKNIGLRMDTLDKKLAANISRLQNDLNQLSNSSSKSTKPKPQINIDSSGSISIDEEPLTE